MLIRIINFGQITMFPDRNLGHLAVNLNVDPMSKITYYGTSGQYNDPVEVEAEKETDEGLLMYFMNPPILAPKNQFRRHKYLITYRTGEVYIRYHAHKVLTLTEHNGDMKCWELTMDGIDMTVIMPADFKVCEEIQES
jgi:hypothetical protein